MEVGCRAVVTITCGADLQIYRLQAFSGMALKNEQNKRGSTENHFELSFKNTNVHSLWPQEQVFVPFCFLDGTVSQVGKVSLSPAAVQEHRLGDAAPPGEREGPFVSWFL